MLGRRADLANGALLYAMLEVRYSGMSCSCKRKGCRKGRPLCRRKDSKRNQTCGCPAYGWPHRVGSGRCFHSKKGAEKMNALAYGAGAA